MSTSSIRAGRAFVEIGTNNNPLHKGLRAAQARIRAFQQAATQAGAALLGTGLAAAVPLALAVRTFSTFEKAMSRVGALSGATSTQMDALREAAKQLGATTAFTATQVADAFSFMAMAGLDVESMLASIGPTLALAAAGQLEIARAADIVTNIMSGMGIAVEDLGGVVDILAQAFTTANTDLDQLGSAMKFVGPIAKTAGVGINEVVAAIQLLSNAGIQGEMAGTSLRGILLALASPSSQAASELEKLGVSVADSEGNMRSMVEIVGDLERGLDGLGSAERLDILGRIFGARPAGAIAELLSQGSAKLAEMVSKLGSAEGRAATIASRQLDNLAGDFTLLVSAVDGVRTSVGSMFNELLRGATQIATLGISGTQRWLEQNRSLVLTYGGITAGAIAAGGALLAIGISVKIVGAAVGGMVVLLKAAFGLIGAMGALMGALVTPIGLTVLSTAALVKMLWDATGASAILFSAIADSSRDAFRTMQTEFERSWAAIKAAVAAGDLEAAFDIAVQTLNLAWFNLTRNMRQWWGEAIVGIKTVFEKFLWDTLAFFDNLASRIEEALTVLMAKFNGLDVDQVRQRFEEERDARAETRNAARDRAMDDLADEFSAVGDKLDQTAKELEAALERSRRAMLGDIGQTSLGPISMLADWEGGQMVAGSFDAAAARLATAVEQTARAAEATAGGSVFNDLQSRGTFSGRVAGLIGGDVRSELRQIAADVAETTRNVRDLLTETRDGEGAVFL